MNRNNSNNSNAVRNNNAVDSSSAQAGAHDTIPAALTPQQRAQQRRAEESRHRQEILKKSLGDAHAAQLTGDETNQRLATQGEQIARISQKLNGMEQDLKTADYHTKSIGSWFGMIWNMVKGAPEETKAQPSEAAQAAANASRDATMAKPVSERKSNRNNNAQQQQAQQQRPKDDDEVEEEHEDALLDQLAHSVHGLRNTAAQQGTVIKAQNVALAETADKMDTTHGHMRQANKNIHRLL